jgi:hypothetical protein
VATRRRPPSAAPWTREQTLALAQLERAFAAAKKAGIAICGMDTDLIAYPSRSLAAALRIAEARPNLHTSGLGGLYEAQRILCDRGRDRTVNTHKVYRDSGGW